MPGLAHVLANAMRALVVLLILAATGAAVRVLPEAPARGEARRALHVFCEADGLGFLAGAEGVAALEELTAWCPEGHLLAVRALLTSGLEHLDRRVRSSALDVLGREAAAVAPERPADADLAGRCAGALAAGLLRGDARDDVVEAPGGRLGELARGPWRGAALRAIAGLAQAMAAQEDADERERAARGLGAALLAAPELGVAEELGAGLVAALAERALQDTAQGVRHGAATALGAIARGGDADLARASVRALSRMARSPALAQLPWLSGRSWAVHVIAGVATSGIETRTGVSALCVEELKELALLQPTEAEADPTHGLHDSVERTAVVALRNVATAAVGRDQAIFAGCARALSEVLVHTTEDSIVQISVAQLHGMVLEHSAGLASSGPWAMTCVSALSQAARASRLAATRVRVLRGLAELALRAPPVGRLTVAAVAAGLQDENLHVRGTAIKWLSVIATASWGRLSAECVAALASLGSVDAAPGNRRLAAVRLGQVVESPAVGLDTAAHVVAALSERFLQDAAPPVRLEAVAALGRVAAGGRGGGAAAAVAALSGATLRDATAQIRVAAAALLGELAAAVAGRPAAGSGPALLERMCDALLVAVQQGTSGVRVAAASSLGQLLLLLPSGPIAARLASALGGVLARDRVATVLRSAVRAARDVAARHESVDLASRCAGALVSGGLSSEDQEVRLDAASALGVVASKARHRCLVAKCVAALASEALLDASEPIRRKAATALGRVSYNSRYRVEVARAAAAAAAALGGDDLQPRSNSSNALEAAAMALSEQALHDRSSSVRRCAAASLSDVIFALKDLGRADLADEYVAILSGQALKDESVAVRFAAAAALRGIGRGPRSLL